MLRALLIAIVLACTPILAAAQEPAPPDTAAAPSFFPPISTEEAVAVSPVADSAARHDPNRRPTFVRMVRLEKGDNVARTGPGDRFSIVGVYPKGRSFPVIAKSGDWYDVRLSDTETGWFHASLCKEFDDLSDLEFKPNPKLYSRAGSLVASGYAGGYSFDRKSNSLVIGGRLGYYLFDRLQAEAGVAWTHITRPAEIVESLFGLTLEAEDFDMVYYQINLTYEVLPGRQMVPYLSGGAGSAIMQGETEASFNLGAGTLLFISKRTAMRWEVRAYQFDSGPADARRTNQNIEFTLGTSFLF